MTETEATVTVIERQPTITLSVPPIDFPWAYRSIVIDGLVWGHVIQFHHGSRGPHYEFRQIGGDGNIERSTEAKYPKPVRVQAFSKKAAERQAIFKRDAGDVRPTTTRIVDEVRALISEGLLRHPAVVREETDTFRKEYAERQKARKEKEEKSIRMRAFVLLGALDGYPDLPSDADLDRVVDVLKREQSR